MCPNFILPPYEIHSFVCTLKHSHKCIKLFNIKLSTKFEKCKIFERIQFLQNIEINYKFQFKNYKRCNKKFLIHLFYVHTIHKPVTFTRFLSFAWEREFSINNT